MRVLKRSHLIALVVFLACGAIGVAIAASEGTPAPSREGYDAGNRASLLTVPTSAQTGTFSILGRSQDATDTMPAEVATQIEASGTFKGLFGANVNLARKAHGFSSGVAWVVPGRSSVCLVTGSAIEASGAPQAGMPGGATCDRESSVADGQMYVVSGSKNAPGEQFIAGMVPNGVTQVTLELSGGAAPVVLPVHENVYMTSVSGAISSVSFDGPSGAVNLDHVGP